MDDGAQVPKCRRRAGILADRFRHEVRIATSLPDLEGLTSGFQTVCLGPPNALMNFE